MHTRGFTLVELVITIVILGIIAAIGAVFLRAPVDSYLDQVRRADLVDSAEMVMRRMAIDIRRALPNSTRTDLDATGGDCTGPCLEMLNVVGGGRYRDRPAAGPGGGNPDKRLQFNQTDDAFNIMGEFPVPNGTYDTRYLVIYNLGSGDANAYDIGGDHNVITQAGTTITLGTDTGLFANERSVLLDPPHRFRHESSARRIYMVDMPIQYLCTGGALWRFTGYPISADTPALDPSADGGQLVARNVADCSFGYDPGTSTRAALVTMTITLTREGESVTLMHQVHVENAP